MSDEEPETKVCDRCGDEITDTAAMEDDRENFFHPDCAPNWVKSYVAEPQPIGDESTTPTLCVGYPVEGGVHLVRRYRDRAGGYTSFNTVASLDDDNVDRLVEELKTFQEQSATYRDNR